MRTDLMTSCHPPTTGRRVAAIIAIVTLFWIAAFLAPALFAQARGPILRITPDPYLFDTTMCGTTKCGALTFSNIGDTALRVYSVDVPAAPFSGTIPTPFDLAPGASRAFEVCYTPRGTDGRDADRVDYRADTRVSMSIGMLFDVSGSMLERMGPSDPTTRIASSYSAGRSFVDNLLTTAHVQDEAAVFQFAATGDYAVRQTWTSDRDALRAAVPNTAPGSYTCLYNAIAQTVGHVAPRANRKVLIVLTDGADACNLAGSTPQTAIAAAQAADVRVFTIGIGGASGAILEQIATATGGRYFTATSMSDLVGVYRTIATLLGQNIDGSFRLDGRAVSPFMVVEPIALAFDSTRVGATRCLPVTIRNIGDAPLVVSALDGISMPFSVGSLPTTPILPGSSATAEICFTPDRLRVLSGSAAFRHNSCGQGPIPLPLAGIGYDSVTLSIGGTHTARPGSVIEIPVILSESLPAIYDVRALELTVAYDKTVLHPAPDFIVAEGTLSATLPFGSSSSAYGATEASTRLAMSGALLSSEDPGGTLVRLAFTVLHGSAIATDVRITGAVMADGNPRVGWVDSARVVADSLCYQADRLIDASARYGSIFKTVLARRDGSAGSAHYTLAAAARTRIALHDALGRELAVVVDEWLGAGDHSSPIDLSTLPNGTYFLRATSGRESDVRAITVAK